MRNRLPYICRVGLKNPHVKIFSENEDLFLKKNKFFLNPIDVGTSPLKFKKHTSPTATGTPLGQQPLRYYAATAPHQSGRYHKSQRFRHGSDEYYESPKYEVLTPSELRDSALCIKLFVRL